MNISTRIASAWKKSTALLGLSLCAVFTASAAETAPILKDNSIEVNGKTVTMQLNGSFSCKNQQGAEILRCSPPYFWLAKDGKDQWGWRDKNFDKSKSKLTREGNKYTWELWYAQPDAGIQSAKLIVQTLELLPDGSFELAYTNELPGKSDAGEFKFWTQTLMLPFSCWLNESWDRLTGKQTLTDDLTKAIAEYEKGGLLKWTFGADKPEKRISVMVKKNPNRQLVLSARKDAKHFQIYSEGAGRNKKTVVYFDFR